MRGAALPRVGVLALQGDHAPHATMLRSLGHDPLEVRDPAQLGGLTHLVLPGGESTTLAHLLALFGLTEPLRAAWSAGRLSLFGTCAGAILLGRCPPGEDPRPPRLELGDVDVSRNAYGRQVHSARRELRFEDGRGSLGTFIRAPRITRVGDGLRVLARDAVDATPVLVQGPGLLLATYHPELGTDPALHRLFLGFTGCREGASALRGRA